MIKSSNSNQSSKIIEEEKRKRKNKRDLNISSVFPAARYDEYLTYFASDLHTNTYAYELFDRYFVFIFLIPAV